MGSRLEHFVGDTLCKLAGVATELFHKWKDKAGCDCEIPETHCPPRCVDSILWTFGRGATPTAAITVRNTGKVARAFNFATTELAGANAGTAKVVVAPASASLAPGDSVVVHLTLEHSDTLTPGQDYQAEFLFTGAWQRCVKLYCEVVEDGWDDCGVEVGEQDKLHLHEPKLSWKIERGMVPEGRITVHNEGDAPATIQVQATPWVGPHGSAAHLVLTPASLTVAPGERGAIDLILSNTDALSPLQDYRCEVVLKSGGTEQRVDLRCFIRRDPADHASVEQGELPTRIRPQHWYTHFQCTEVCDPSNEHDHGHEHHHHDGCC